MYKSDSDTDVSQTHQSFETTTKNIDLYREYLEKMPELEEKSEMMANEFDYDLEWYNSEPLYFESSLKNKLVLIDFWTSCCCDCLHLLPVLEKLEHKFEKLQGLAFIGAHSGKFEAESDSFHLKKNILKYDIKHPVINDVGMQLWSEYECYYWPTVFIIAPNQKVLKVYKEHVPTEDLEVFLEAAYDYYSPDLNLKPLPITLETEKERNEKESLAQNSTFFSQEKEKAIKSNLRFPHKITYVPRNDCKMYGCDLMIISDMGNNRVVLVNADTYRHIDVIGAGKSGYKDGDFGSALFNQTFGTAYLDGKIYICDGKNHMIRVANLETRTVSTLAGTGNRRPAPEPESEDMLQQNLSTPFDITYSQEDKCFYVAMSGIHQIWKLDIQEKTIKPFAGSSVEGCHDDPHDLMHSTLAQPCGVSLGVGKEGKEELFVADSESSSIRAINLTDKDSTRTVVGGDGTSTNLFSYGDQDGEGIGAKLQHPMGLHYIEPLKKVIITDSYNHKVKMLDPVTNEITTIFGNGQMGLKDGHGQEAQFIEPTDIAYKYDGSKDEVTLFIADSSNDCIRSVVIYSEGQYILEASVETILFKRIPSIVEIVKSNMVECGENGCKWIRPKGRKSKKKKSENLVQAEPLAVSES